MIYLVTGNKNKLREFEEILGFKLSHIDLDLEEIQAVEVKKVIEHKTRQAFNIIKKPVVCEDSGLYLDAWRGLPGALVKFFEKTIGYRNLCKLLGSNRKAKAQTVIGYFDGENYFNFTGEVSGKIAQKPEGKNGFGWDVVFIPNRNAKTFAQMTPVEKNKISMRKIALEKLRKFLA